MKRRFSKILGVGLTLALLTSLLLTAAPVSADVTQPSVTVDPNTISKAAEYTIRFKLGAELGAADALDTITITFPSGTIVSDTIGATIVAGPGWIGSPPAWITNPTTGITFDGDADARTVTATLTASDGIGESAEVRIAITSGITNPATVASYKLTVATSVETTAVTSAAYSIIKPEIDVLPGVVELYNPSGILMGNWTDDDAIFDAIAEAGEDYVIEVGSGTYAWDLVIEAGKDNLELVGAEGAVIKGAATELNNLFPRTVPNINILADGVTIHGFTIESPDAVVGEYASGMLIGAKDVEIYDNTFETDTQDSGQYSVVIQTWHKTVIGFATVDISGLNIHDNTFTDLGDGAVGYDGIFINLDTGTETATIQDNQFTGSIWRAISVERSNMVISGNTIVTDLAPNVAGFTGGFQGMYIGCYPVDSAPGPLQTDVSITGNTVKGATTDDGFAQGIRVGHTTQVALQDITVLRNTVQDCDEGITVRADATGVAVNSNDIVDNTVGVQNDDTNTLDATFNWWGTDIGADIADMVSTLVTYEPFLADTAEAVFSGSDVAVGETSIAKGTADVAVSVAGTDVTVATIAVAKYIDNPQEAIADAIAFFDVYVAGVTVSAGDPTATIKFYAGDANTKVYIWSADTETWGEVEGAKFSAYGGYVWVTVDPAMLAGTPFALVAGEAEAILAPQILAPDVGAKDVDLKPTLAWKTVPDAIGYDFELADNPLFVAPIVKLTGDLARLIVTFYQKAAELDYSTYYYWRVKAVSATAESAWSAGVFSTVAEAIPEPEPEPRMWVCPQCGLTYSTRAKLEAHAGWAHLPEEPADIIIEPPDIIVPLPAETPITPAWIYVIIGVGAVLVIALIVLIVRTRRVA